MPNPHDALFKDLEAVRQIAIVPTMLDVICQTTGMRFAAVARVTADRWVTCSVKDEIEFGLKPGDELKLETTICDEIRGHRQPVIIDHVAEDPVFKDHHTPAMYGFQSYISYPIILKNGEFFGTLCAIDPRPADLNNSKIKGMFSMFAELLAFHLQGQELLERSYIATMDLDYQNKILTSINQDLDSFVYTAAHDLKSPIGNIAALLDVLSEMVSAENVNREEIRKVTGLMKGSLNRFSATINDLTTFVEAENVAGEETEEINLREVIEHVKQDLSNLILMSNARIEVVCEEKVQVNFSKKNFKSVLHNLLSNALKYRSPERIPEVLVKMDQADGKVKLSVTDNGLGIPADNQDKVFTMFKRFHNHVEGTGLGLYIVKRLVDNRKGQVQVNSAVNQGTTFTITF